MVKELQIGFLIYPGLTHLDCMSASIPDGWEVAFAAVGPSRAEP